MTAPAISSALGFAGLLLAISILGSRKSKDPALFPSIPTALDRTVSEDTARALQEELRLLMVRLEAIGSLVRNLKASHDQGHITDEEFKSLAAKHTDEISQLEQEIVRRRLVIELFELEEIEGKLARAFAMKIAELNETILLLRKKLGMRTEGGGMAMDNAREGVIVPPSSQGSAAASPPMTASSPPPSTLPTPTEPKATKPSKKVTSGQDLADAAGGEGTEERDVEEELSRIRTDVEKLLDELEQMEQPHG
jgi:hypothetical protein